MIRSSVLAFLCLAVLGTPLVAAAGCYGPVGRNDTLWLIALRLRPDPSISPQRMMLALLEANPEAFGRNNINALYAGSTLCVGPLDSIETDERAAIAQVRRHNRDWTSGRAPVGSGSHVPPPAPSGAAAGSEEPARPHRAVAAGTLVPESALSQEDLGQHGSLRLDRAVAAGRVASLPGGGSNRASGVRLPQRGRDADQGGAGSARDAGGPHRRSDQGTDCVSRNEGRGGRARGNGADADPGTAESRGDGADADSGAAEPRGDGADAHSGAAESRGDGADAHSPPSHEARRPRRRRATRMEPMPTPAPPSHEAMEPMPTPAPPTGRRQAPSRRRHRHRRHRRSVTSKRGCPHA